jgi:serine/threonine-protein kinase
MVGRELGNYVTDSLLGTGGMGAVFAGHHRFLGTKVAIKLLHGSYAQSPDVTQRFFQEAKSSIEVAHPSVVKILDFGQTTDGSLYLVMELLEGRSLAGTLAAGRLSEAEAARIGAAIADGMAAAHTRGIVHRDLKPDNVFCAATGEIKILDFGIAKVLTSSSGTRTGSILGTPQYMAPEQARGAKQIGPHTDIYSLGAILFEMVCGRPPFTGDEVAEVLMKHIMDPPPVPSSIVSTIQPGMEALILQCLEKPIDKRPSSMIEVRDRLAAMLAKLAPDGRTIGAVSGSFPVLSNTPRADPSGSFRADPSGSFRASAPAAPTLLPSGTHSTLTGAAAEVVSPPPQKSSRAGVFAVAGLLLIGAGAVAFVKLRPPAASPAAAPVVAAATAPLPAPPAPKTVKVVIRSTPPGAAVLLDGKQVGFTPLATSVSPPQNLTLSLAGHQTLNEVVTKEGELSFQLEAVAAPVAAQPKPAHKPPAPAKKKSAPSILD